MKVLIVGGTGFLGLEGAMELIRRGHSVRSIALRPLTDAVPRPAQFELHTGNYMNMSDDELRDLMKDCEGFVFAAGADERMEGPPPIYDLYKKCNIDGLRRLLAIAKELGITRAVVCGSYFTHFNAVWPKFELEKRHPYILSRVEQEKMALSFADRNFHVAVLGFPYIFGVQPGRRPVWVFLARILQNMRLATFFPKGGTTMITARQAGQCIAGALENNTGANAYPIGFYNMSWNEMVAIMNRSMGMPDKKIVNIPQWIFRMYCHVLARRQARAGNDTGLFYPEIAKTMYDYMYIDKTLAVERLNVEPDNIVAAIEDCTRFCCRILDGEEDAIAVRSE